MTKTGSILPEETLNAILRTGSNHNRTELRLIYNFMSVQTKEEYEEFVRNEYGNGGKGFIIDGKKYAVWFNKNGMQIALGETVRTKDKIHLSWEQVTNRIHCLLKEGEFAPQSMLDKAQDNAIKEHAQALAYMKGDMAEGVAEIVFAEKDLPHLRSIYPEITDYLENKMKDPAWLSELNKRLSGVANAYKKSKTIMRFHYYDPVTVSKRFHKLAAEVTPYKAKDGFVSTEQKIFITQDEIDSFMIKRGSYSERRLRTYSFYLLNEDKKSRTDFIKKQYGTGGQNYALSGADNSYANYDGKGLVLARGNYGNPQVSISLSWDKVANRIAYLIKNDQFLQAEDYARMPEYEREHMADKILRFYNRLPEAVDRPFTNDFFWEKPRKEIADVLKEPIGAEKLLQKMDAVLADLPLDFNAYGTSYSDKADILSQIHKYLKGDYTIFPIRKEENKLPIKAENVVKQKKINPVVNNEENIVKEKIGHQMTIFDYLAIS